MVEDQKIKPSKPVYGISK